MVLYTLKRCASRLHAFDVYSSPNPYTHTFNKLLTWGFQSPAPHPLIIVGDFRPPHCPGVQANKKEGSALVGTGAGDTAVESDLAAPSRRNSDQDDTSTDLMLTRNVGEVKWHYAHHTLGRNQFAIGSNHQVSATLAP